MNSAEIIPNRIYGHYASRVTKVKKAFFKDLDTEFIADVLKEKGAKNKLIRLFSCNPGKEFDVDFLAIICVGNRDWTRVIRDIRQNEDMNIVHIRKSIDCPNGGYIYLP